MHGESQAADVPEGTSAQRDLARLPVAIKVRVSCASADAFSAHFSQNLSIDGVFVRSTTPRPVGSTLEVEYVLPDGQLALRGKGVVRWVRGAGGNDIGPPGMGVQLVDIDDAGKRFLASLLVSQGAAVPPWVTAVAAAAAYQPLAPPPDMPASMVLDEDGNRPNADASPLAPVAMPRTVRLTDTRHIDQKLALVLDLSGSELAAGLALRDAQGSRVGAPTTLSPRFVVNDDGFQVQLGGVWVPCLVALVGLSWPSPSATLWGRRFGLQLGGDGHGGVAMMLGGRTVPASDALEACLHELVSPYASSEMLPAQTHIILPTQVSPRAIEVARRVLGEYHSEVGGTHGDAAALVAATFDLRIVRKPVLVVTASMLDTWVTVVDVDGVARAKCSALDTGLWRADEMLADQIASRLVLTHGVRPDDESAFRRELATAVANARVSSDDEDWRLPLDSTTHVLSQRELCDLATVASIRVLLACEMVLHNASLAASDLERILLVADEPPWPGLVDALGQGLGMRPEVASNTQWCRIEGVAALLGNAGHPQAAIGEEARD